MQKIIMLGTGHGLLYNCYNTCFLLQNDDEYFLVDTGGSTHIIQNLEKLNINLNKIHNIFISHSHTDHILGLFWLLKRITGMVRSKKYDGFLNIYCNSEVANAIKNIYPYLFPATYSEVISKYLNIKNLILYHTEDTHLENRKELYTKEAKLYFNNNVIVPDDLETIDLD